MQLINYSAYLFVGYLVGIWLAAPGLFSWTVTATMWSNLLVYVYMVFWPFILLWYFLIAALILSAIGFVAFIIFAYFKK
jgi:hypothetical protein